MIRIGIVGCAAFWQHIYGAISCCERLVLMTFVLQPCAREVKRMRGVMFVEVKVRRSEFLSATARVIR